MARRLLLPSTLPALALAALAAAGCQGDQTDPNLNKRNESMAPPDAGPPPVTEEHTEAPMPEKEGPKVVYTDKAFRLTIEATLSGLPAGARVIAPSARDRRYQKVTKSEHSGIAGSVMPAEDGQNLFFVSDPVKEGQAEVKYAAVFEVERRVGTQGDPSSVKEVDFEGEEGKVEGASADAALAAAAAALREAKGKPSEEIHAVLEKALAWKYSEGGTDDPAQAVAGAEATALGIAEGAVQLARLRGVPARVVQGLRVPDGAENVTRTHAWLEAKLPQLDYVPFDPVEGRDESGPPVYEGILDAGRVEYTVGTEVALPEDGTLPKTTLRGNLAAPFAVLNGERVGTVTWSAKVEAITPKPPE